LILFDRCNLPTSVQLSETICSFGLTTTFPRPALHRSRFPKRAASIQHSPTPEAATQLHRIRDAQIQRREIKAERVRGAGFGVCREVVPD
jgi:hypothetical protein